MSTDVVIILSLPASAGVFYINLELLKRIKISHLTLAITLSVKWEHYASKLILREIRSLVDVSKDIGADLILVGSSFPRLPLQGVFRRVNLLYNFVKAVAYGDVVHFTWPWSNRYLKILRSLDKKIISNCYDIIPLKLPELYPWPRFNKYIYFWKKSDAVSVLSLNTKRDLISLGVNGEKIFITYPGVDAQIFHPIEKIYARRELKLPIDKKILLYVGSMEPKRAVPMKAFLQAYRSLLEKHRDITLILAGPFKYIHERANKNIIILHNVPREKLPILYASADIFIFPTLYEGFGIPPLEAMACGTPAIVPSNSSIPEVVGDAGIYVENPLNPREWYDRANILLEDEGLRNYLSKKGIMRAHDFSWDKSAETLREIYETISRR